MIALGGVVPDWLAAIVASGVGAGALYFAQLLLQWRKQAAEEESARESAGLEIKKHRDRLTIEMLEAARTELQAARAEIRDLRAELEVRADELDRLRRVEWRLAAYEEAIEHIEALLRVEQSGGREAAEHAARVFLARMEALRLKMGDAAQAEQIERAKHKLEHRKDEG